MHKNLRNEYILEYVLKRSEQTLPIPTKKNKGFSELGRELNISRGRVAQIYFKELIKFFKTNERGLYHYLDPRRN